MGGPLGPIANLIGFSVAGLGAGQGVQSTPPIGQFTGLGDFLKTPATSTFLFNDVLFSSSNQQVPIDFKAGGPYTGIPPLFGGRGFTGLAPRFDFFANNSDGLFGVDGILALENLMKAGLASSTGNRVTGAATDTAAKPADTKPAGKPAGKAADTAAADKPPAGEPDLAKLLASAIMKKFENMSALDLLKALIS